MSGTKPIDAVKARMEATFARWTRETTLAQMRADFDDALGGTEDVPFRAVEVAGMPGAWFGTAGEGVPPAAILYVHGGGYQVGSIRSHRGLMGRLSAAAGLPLLAFDYRLAPEHRHPAALDDCLAAWRWLLGQGVTPGRVAIAGDSAGAALALATMLRARAEGTPLPGAAALLSPWLDLEATGESLTTRAGLDPMTPREKLQVMARLYLGREGDPRHPFASPIHGDFAGLPPTVVHVGDHEAILSDSETFADRARAAGVAVELEVWPEMIHHFQIFPELPEAERSLAKIGAFLRARVG
ncbi:alpha/beta hydrolase [Albimonas sp. CAU 1670]|uniref:alpha/beta hydrolase n=1 Tax=Albimonas sp. CAU 1670 TaxID=3032599 RepID=UPI0023D9AD60|nr:alpha/beta hydrolase [Albimonas sp. CAU 1670]MDF2234088.1 alpha/beta hydrolase [Albimonas sp. CAU 1670]